MVGLKAPLIIFIKSVIVNRGANTYIEYIAACSLIKLAITVIKTSKAIKVISIIKLDKKYFIVNLLYKVLQYPQ